MSGFGLLWQLIPPGRCRQLLAAAAALVISSAAIALVPALVVAAIAAVVFDRVDLGFTVMQVVFTGIAAVIARLGLLLLARNTAGSATEWLSQSLRARIAVKIGTLPLGVLTQLPPASLETLLLDDVEAVSYFVSERLMDTVGAYAMIVAAVTLLGARDWRLGLALASPIVVAGSIVRLRGRRAPNEIEAERRTREEFAALVFGSVRTLALRRSLPGDTATSRPARLLAQRDRRAADLRLERSSSRRVARRAASTALAPVIVIAAAGAAGAGADLPALVLTAALAVRLSGALATVFTTEAAGGSALESAGRIGDLLRRPSLVEGRADVPSTGDVSFRGVTFAYPGAGGRGDVVRDIEFTAAAGRVTAIVGPSGAGKTTLTRLAARLWDVDRGAVELGGIDIRTFPVDAFMRHIACVFQDVALLDDTVAANLKLGRPEATDEELTAAARAAGASFVEALPAGLNTVIGDRGLSLSRGERQRLQIARALLKDAPIVILDEPTASLDPATELEVQATLATLFRDKTVLVVAHRLATIVSADRIVVLGRDGRIEAQGSHADLLGDSPTYAGLWSDYAASAPSLPRTALN